MARSLGTSAQTVLLLGVLSSIPFALRAEQAQSSQLKGSGRALSASQRRVVFSGPFAPNRIVPSWDRGYLISRELETAAPGVPNVWLYDADGNPVSQLAIWIPGSVRVLLSNAAMSPDGRIVVTGFAEQKDSTQAFFIALADRAGKILRAIQTNPFVPMELCVAADGTVWTAGGVRSDSLELRDAAEVLRHFDFDRGLIEAYLPLSSFGTRRDVAGNLGPLREAFLGCGADRVVLYSGAANQYLELSILDHSIHRWRIDRSLRDLPVNGFALTPSGELYASLYDQENPSRSDGVYWLHRDPLAGMVRWMTVESSDPRGSSMQDFGYLFGADGESLVHSRRETGFSTLYWSAPSRPSAGRPN